MAAFEAWLVFLIRVVNVVGELERKRTLAASRGFLAAARLSCFDVVCSRIAYALGYRVVRVTTLGYVECVC